MALVGARSMSEFISRSISVLGNGTNYNFLDKTLNYGVNKKTFTICASMYVSTTGKRSVVYLYDNSSKTTILGYLQLDPNGNRVLFSIGNVGNGYAVITTSDITISYNTWYNILVSIDLSDVNKRSIVINRNLTASAWTSYVNSDILLSNINYTTIGRSDGSTTDGLVSGVYISTDYIDFSQESNRNLFVNQLGYVRSLDEPIAQGLIPEPLIYLKFDDPSNLGKNSGSGSDFQINGSVTQGSDFSVN